MEVLGAHPATAGRRQRSRVGIAWKDGSAPAELTVRETVRPFARSYPHPRDPDETIAPVGLEAKAGSRAKALPGGQRRRLDGALGVIGSPGLLVLDEPPTGFDPAARRRTAARTLLGIAISRLPGPGRSAGSVVILPFLCSSSSPPP